MKGSFISNKYKYPSDSIHINHSVYFIQPQVQLSFISQHNSTIMQTVLALVVFIGSVSAGQIGFSYDAGLPAKVALNAARNGQFADLDAIDRNYYTLAVGAHNGAVRDNAALRDAILTVISGARAAAIRDQINLQRASATLAIINADGAARNAAAQAAINNYAALRNAAIQSQQLGLARISNRGFLGYPAGLGYSAPALSRANAGIPIPLGVAVPAGRTSGSSQRNSGIPIGLGIGIPAGFSDFGYGGPGNFAYGFGTGAAALGSKASSRRSRKD